MKRPMIRRRATGCKIARVLAAALAGGTMWTSCETRLKQSVAGGAEQFLLGLLSPDNPEGLGSLFLPDEDS